jgi:hypothetical protein
MRMPCSPTRLATLSFLLTIAPVAARAGAQTLSAGDSTPVIVRTISDSVPAAASEMGAAPSRGASMNGLRSAVHVKETPRALQPNAAATHANLGQARAMIIVGAAALVTGAIIGGDPGTIIMVGGAVVGLYGLYQYLQ